MKSLTAAALKSAAICAAATLCLAAQAQNIATVNGKPVPKSRVDLILRSVPNGQAGNPAVEKMARERVVLREMLAQEAEKRGLVQSTAYKEQLDMARQDVLISLLFAEHQRKNPITDEVMKAEYEKTKVEVTANPEVQARHILVEKEEEAKALLAQINAGAKFDELAKKHSKDPGSAEKGGDLGFANPQGYVPPFRDALKNLKKGETTQQPVKSDFGYHIIRLEDTRAATFPDFDQLRDRIKQSLEQKQLAKLRDDVRARSKTDFKFSDGE